MHRFLISLLSLTTSLAMAGLSIAMAFCLLPGCSGGLFRSPITLGKERLTLYEGLPHQFYESAALKAEKKAKPTVEHHGFSFYQETLELKGKDEESLRTLLKDPRTFQPFAGEKKCGGFHPDYAVKWIVDGKSVYCLICFGCYELKVYEGGRETTYDMGQETRDRLRDLLKPYRQNRPPENPSLF